MIGDSASNLAFHGGKWCNAPPRREMPGREAAQKTAEKTAKGTV